MSSMDDLYAACRLQSNRKLADAGAQDRAALHLGRHRAAGRPHGSSCARSATSVKYRAQVYDDWGFDRKLALGKGLNVLFAGPSGTGKTMAAEIIAGELGLDLYKIDLSTRGQQVHRRDREEPGAHLRRGRDQQRHPVLRRGRRPLRQAHRGAGRPRPLRQHRDRLPAAADGGVRRRGRSWPPTCARTWTRPSCGACTSPWSSPSPTRQTAGASGSRSGRPTTPLQPDLDLDFLARRFELAGGNIRNIALAAAFLAADEGRS